MVGGIPKEKTARITDAMADLQLGIDGLRSQLPAATDGSRWAQVLGSFARACSVFLRKTVLGDHDRRETRLLDDRVLGSIGLRFGRLRKIPRDRRRKIEVGFGLAGGLLQLTKLDDLTGEPQAAYGFRAGPQEVKLSIEWPLPGAADWTGVPSKETPWLVSADQLFQTSSGSGLSCDEWLGQQVVLFDGKGISLKEMIRTVVNFEGAHSINVGRLASVEGEEASGAAKNPAPAHPECRYRVWNPLCAPDRDRVCSVPVREAVRRELDQAAERGHLQGHTRSRVPTGAGGIPSP